MLGRINKKIQQCSLCSVSHYRYERDFFHLKSRMYIYKTVIYTYSRTAIRNNLVIFWIDCLILGNVDYLKTFQIKQRGGGKRNADDLKKYPC
jgi:hypothetical protein